MFKNKQKTNNEASAVKPKRPIYWSNWLSSGGGGTSSSGQSYSQYLDLELRQLIDDCGIDDAEDLIAFLKKLPEVQEGLKNGAMKRVLEKEAELEKEKANARKVGADV